MRIESFSISGLGHQSSLIADDDAGVAAIVDPRRDVDVYLEAARAADLRITHVVETHLHNDYVSGGRELAALTGATHVIGARGGSGTSTGPGGWRRVRRRCAPVRRTGHAGHTPEHVSYTVADTSRAAEPLLVFRGGSLLVGAVGRTDLLGADHAVPYAHDMYHSLHDVLLRLEDFVAVNPTHGAGSLCSTGIASTPLTTIGFERRYNPLLAPMDADAFARALLAGQPAIPRYFARMRPMNQGARLLTAVVVTEPPAMTPDAVERRSIARCLIVDARATAHPRGRALPGFPLDPARRVVRDVARLGRRPGSTGHAGRRAKRRTSMNSCARRCASVMTRSSGHLAGGIEAWTSSGREIEAGGRWGATELAGAMAGAGAREAPLLIDVRQASEYEIGPRPGRLAHHRRIAPGPAGRPAAGSPDRVLLRGRVPGLDRHVVVALCRLPAGRLGIGRLPGLECRRASGRGGTVRGRGAA